MDYELDIEIDEDFLDIECLEQPGLALKYGKHWARCQRKLTQAEEKIKVIRAELIKQANDNPNKYLGRGVKPTGANVEAYYRMHPKHIKAKDEWVQAQYECNVAAAAKSEFSFARKTSLELLVQLHGQNYFAGPRVPHNLSEEREKRQKKVDQGIASKMKRNK